MSEQNYSPFKIRYGSVSDWENRSPNPDPGTLYFVTNEQGQCFMYFDSPVLENTSEQNSSQSGSENNTSQPFSIISEEDKQKIEQIVLPPEPGEEITDTETDSFLINYEQYQKLYDLKLNDNDIGGTFYAPVLQGSNGDILKSNGDKTFSWVSSNGDKQALLGITYEQNRQYLITSSEKDNIAKLSNILKLKINGTNIGNLSQELNIYDPGLAGGQNYFLISNNSNKPSWSNNIETLQLAIGITYGQNRKYLITNSEKNNIAKLPNILNFNINGTMIGNITNTYSIYAPTSSGSQGQVLISDNPNAPIWKTLADAGIQSNSGSILRATGNSIGITTDGSILGNNYILLSGYENANTGYSLSMYYNTHNAALYVNGNEAKLEVDASSLTSTTLTLPSGGIIKINDKNVLTSAIFPTKINGNNSDTNERYIQIGSTVIAWGWRKIGTFSSISTHVGVSSTVKLPFTFATDFAVIVTPSLNYTVDNSGQNTDISKHSIICTSYNQQLEDSNNEGHSSFEIHVRYHTGTPRIHWIAIGTI